MEGFSIDNPTTLAFGPDGRLYVGMQNGWIVALTLEGQTVAGLEVVAHESALGDVLGIAFDQNAPPSPVTLYVSHSAVYRGKDGPRYPGKVTKLVAPVYEPIDIITGLPVSAGEHATNGLIFDDEGRLYIGQGGTTNAGFPSERHPRPESPLSGAILVADLQDPGFDGAVKYDPPDEVGDTVNQVSGDVRVYASGFRNPYDLLLHSNGKIYATENGPNVPDGRRLVNCMAEEPDPWEPDELNLIVEDQYYGHPNPNRARFDPRQCTYSIPLDTSQGATPPIALLGYSTSVNGIVEYTGDAFDGRMKGDLIYVEWMTNRIWRVVLTEDGYGVVAISRLIPGVFDQPLDVTVGPDGTIYVAEFRGDRISSLTPAPANP